jgi:hypothetical protein
MSVRGRNASGILTQRIAQDAIAGNDSVSTGFQSIYAAVRSSVFVKEAGLVITPGGPGSTTVTQGVLHPSIRFHKPGDANSTLLGSVGNPNDIAASTSVGSEFTTRDASFQFADDYANASDRVFPKGTTFFAINSSVTSGNAADKYMAYIQIEEAGAPPA